MLVKGHSLLKAMVASLGLFGLMLTSCTDDQKSTENPVTSSSSEHPVSPSDAGGAGDFKAQTVYFAFDSSHLDDVTQQKLEQLGKHLLENKEAKVEVAGHTDERGTNEYNLALGLRRAEAVKKYLINLGVDAMRVSTVSFGEEHPAAEGHSEDAWKLNRRSEFNANR